jgi:hypothetical protein
MRDCAVTGELAACFSGASVAIDRVNCLLKDVVAGYLKNQHPIAACEQTTESN